MFSVIMKESEWWYSRDIQSSAKLSVWQTIAKNFICRPYRINNTYIRTKISEVSSANFTLFIYLMNYCLLHKCVVYLMYFPNVLEDIGYYREAICRLICTTKSPGIITQSLAVITLVDYFQCNKYIRNDLCFVLCKREHYFNCWKPKSVKWNWFVKASCDCPIKTLLSQNLNFRSKCPVSKMLRLENLIWEKDTFLFCLISETMVIIYVGQGEFSQKLKILLKISYYPFSVKPSDVF